MAGGGGAGDELLEAFARGEAGAIARVNEIVERIVGARGHGIPREDRRDLAQQALTQIWQAVRDPASAPPRRFEAFVCAVSHRRCVDWWRRKRPRAELREALEDPASRPEARLLDEEKLELGRRALAALGPRCRELLRMQAHLELRPKEIARLQGRSEHAVRVALSDCLKRARAARERLERGSGGAGPGRDDGAR